MEVCGKEIRFKGRLIRIAHLAGEGYQFLDDPEEALRTLRGAAERADVFTFIQRISEATPRYNYPLEWDNLAVLPISTFDHWWKEQVRNKTRNMVRQAERKGVVIREVPFDKPLVRGIHAIYNESPIRQDRRFRHYGEDLETVRRITSTFPDLSIFIGAFFEGELIGFVKLVTDEERTQAGLMHILSLLRHRDKAAANAMVAQAVRSCAERRISYLWYANFSYGRRQRDSLADFKRHNGFEKVELPRYYVPLTVRGRAALHMGLHHALIDWIPAPLATRYRRIRSLWYAKKFPGSENAEQRA